MQVTRFKERGGRMKIFLLERVTQALTEARAMVVIAENEVHARRLAVGRRVDVDESGPYLLENFKDEGPLPWIQKRGKRSRCSVIGDAAPGAKPRVVAVD